MRGLGYHPGQHLLRWGAVRLRMTLWNVAVLALILGALGGVVRYKVQADRFATVDRTLAERANEAGHQYVFIRSHTFGETSVRRHGRHRSGSGHLPEHHRGARGPDDNREQGRRRHGGSDPAASLFAADVTVVPTDGDARILGRAVHADAKQLRLHHDAEAGTGLASGSYTGVTTRVVNAHGVDMPSFQRERLLNADGLSNALFLDLARRLSAENPTVSGRARWGQNAHWLARSEKKPPNARLPIPFDS